MSVHLLKAPSFGEFFTTSALCQFVLEKVLKQAKTDGLLDNGSMDETRITIGVKLSIETLLKHNLTSHQLRRITLTDFIDDDNSLDVRNYYNDAVISEDPLALSNLDSALAWIKSATNLIMTRQHLHHQRDIAMELKQEFLAISQKQDPTATAFAAIEKDVSLVHWTSNCAGEIFLDEKDGQGLRIGHFQGDADLANYAVTMHNLYLRHQRLG